MKRRRVRRNAKSSTSQPLTSFQHRISLACQACGKMVNDLSVETKAVTCWICVAVMLMPMESTSEPEEKRPRGWHLMSRYVDASGKVYHKGRVVYEASSSGDA